MVSVRLIDAVCVVLLAACGTLPAMPDTPYLPPGVFGVYEDNDIGAINQSAWAFADPARALGNPIDAARAVIAVEYLAGELRSNPRWIGMSAFPKLEMVQARADMRRALGIAPDAPPQLVVEALLRLIGALWYHNQHGALQSLDTPVFTLPPAQTLQVLSNLPYIRSANVATQSAANEAFFGGGQ